MLAGAISNPVVLPSNLVADIGPRCLPGAPVVFPRPSCNKLDAFEVKMPHGISSYVCQMVWCTQKTTGVTHAHSSLKRLQVFCYTAANLACMCFGLLICNLADCHLCQPSSPDMIIMIMYDTQAWRLIMHVVVVPVYQTHPSFVFSEAVFDLVTPHMCLLCQPLCAAVMPRGYAIASPLGVFAGQLSAYQSSVLTSSGTSNGASNVVDGNNSTCMATALSDTKPWLVIDLGQRRAVAGMRITNNLDCCQGGRPFATCSYACVQLAAQ